MRLIPILAIVCATTLAAERAPAPELRVVSWAVDDLALGVGNGDGGLHPGEEVLLSVTLSNQGTANATGVSAVLDERIPHPDVEIVDKIALWNDLPATGAPGTSFLPHFRLRVAATRPCSWKVPLQLTITADGGYERVVDIDLPLTDPKALDLRDDAVGSLLYGRDTFDRLGETIEFCDMDGDGREELIVGVPGGDGLGNVGNARGEVVVIYGQAGGLPSLDLLTAGGSGIATIYGASNSDSTGLALACGDLDGDGLGDLAIGAPGGDGPADAGSERGEVTIIWGNAARLPASLQLPSGDPQVSWTIYGPEDFDGLGEDVAFGDLDGDGYQDLIATSPNGDGASNLRPAAGEAHIVYGRPFRSFDTDLASFVPDGVALIEGAVESDYTTAVEALDLDGDGFDEVAFAHPRGFRTSIVYGGPERIDQLVLTSANANVVELTKPGTFDWPDGFASGDLDGDGLDDLAIGGGTFADPGGSGGQAGQVDVLYGSAERLVDTNLGTVNDVAVTIFGRAGSVLGGDASLPSAPDRLAIGDIDGDGFDDLVAGANTRGRDVDTNVGSLAIVRGRAGRLPDIDMASPPVGTVEIVGRDAGDRLGFGVAIGDFDGDGRAEIAGGAREGDGPPSLARSGAGELVLVAGRDRTRMRHDPEAYAFIDATGGNALALDCDDCGATVPIGFTFEFYGRRYDEVTISSNGYLSFDGEGDRPFGFCPPRSASPNGLIAVWWEDLDLTVRGEVTTLLEGVAPNRRLTVQWDAVPVFPDTGELTFAVTLFESSDRIVMQYADTEVEAGHPSNGGAQAVVAVENAAGTSAAPFSCFASGLADSSAIAFRAFDNPTPFYLEDFEAGQGAWTGTGLWHRISEPTCTPSSASGSAAYYYGQDGACNYDTGAANAGTLSSPNLGTLPQDAELTYWQRRGMETGVGFDVSLIEVQGDAGTWDRLGQTIDGLNGWRTSLNLFAAAPVFGRFASLDLSGYAGESVALRFNFDSVDATANGGTGWMIDDVAVHACPVFDAGGGGGAPGAAAEARATARPGAICEDQAGALDAIGSYCTACDALTYQWSVDGAEIPGATGLTLPIAAGAVPGTYDYTVAIDCATPAPCAAVSDVAEVDVVQKPVDIGPTLRAVKSGADVVWSWSSAAGADDYVLFSDTSPVDRVGGFAWVEGATASTGLALPLAGDTRFYLTTGRNPTCGLGPR